MPQLQPRYLATLLPKLTILELGIKIQVSLETTAEPQDLVYYLGIEPTLHGWKATVLPLDHHYSIMFLSAYTVYIFNLMNTTRSTNVLSLVQNATMSRNVLPLPVTWQRLAMHCHSLRPSQCPEMYFHSMGPDNVWINAPSLAQTITMSRHSLSLGPDHVIWQCILSFSQIPIMSHNVPSLPQILTRSCRGIFDGQPRCSTDGGRVRTDSGKVFHKTPKNVDRCWSLEVAAAAAGRKDSVMRRWNRRCKWGNIRSNITSWRLSRPWQLLSSVSLERRWICHERFWIENTKVPDRWRMLVETINSNFW